MQGKLSKIITLFRESPKFTVEDKLAEFEGRPDSNLYHPDANSKFVRNKRGDASNLYQL